MHKSEMVSFRLEKALLRKLDLLGLAKNCSRAEVLRRAVDTYFQVHTRRTADPDV
jgi:hypothetical protein